MTAQNETMRNQRDYPEDFGHANGRYLHTCKSCKRHFEGYKRRVICKVCANATPQPPDTGARETDPETPRSNAAYKAGIHQLYARSCTLERELADAKEKLSMWKLSSVCREKQLQIDAQAEEIERLKAAFGKLISNAEQFALESWVERNPSSDDHEAMMRAWHESSDYADFMSEWGDAKEALSASSGEGVSGMSGTVAKIGGANATLSLQKRNVIAIFDTPDEAEDFYKAILEARKAADAAREGGR